MQLQIVLLPDPFGPIRPRISPSFTSNETSLTARRAPNLFERPETLSIGMWAIPYPLHPSPERGGSASEASRGGVRLSAPHPVAFGDHPPLAGRDRLPRVRMPLGQRQHGIGGLDARRPGDL